MVRAPNGRNREEGVAGIETEKHAGMLFADKASNDQMLEAGMDNRPISLFGGTIGTLERSLNLRSRKHETIINNVANADTPNYKPFVLDVEKSMQQASAKMPSPGKLQLTDDRHLPETPVGGISSADGSKQEANPLLLRGDQNGVDIDAEMAELAKNSLLYRASAQIIASKFSGLKKVITGGNK